MADSPRPVAPAGTDLGDNASPDVRADKAAVEKIEAALNNLPSETT